MLLFHGFGQTHDSMKPVVNSISHSYTCYNFDIFFHGKSTGPEEKSLQIEDWNELMNKFFKKENLDEINLTGFSLGAKYVLAILMGFHKKVNLIYFMAPDGIKTNIWYNLATYPHFLRRYFRSMIRHPQRFYVLVRSLRKLRLISKSLARFVEKQMKTPDQRVQVYKSWVGIRHVKFRPNEIIRLINDEKIPVHIFLGKNDKIIPAKPFKKFCNRAVSCRLIILNAAHYDLIKEASAHISEKISTL